MSAINLNWKTGVGAQSYQVWRSETNNSATAALLADGVQGNTYSDTTAVDGTTYYYWIKSVNAGGASGFSAASTDIAGSKTLAAPTGVVATVMAEEEITIVWAAVSGATKYDVWRHTSENFAAATKIGSNVAATSYVDDPPADDTLYVYWIVAKDDASHESEPSLAAGGFAALPAPTVPTGVAASDGVANKVTVSWTTVAGATSFEVWRSTTNNSSTATKIAGGITGTSYDNTLGVGTLFYYWVKAKNYQGTSGFSASDSGYAYIPPPPPPPAPDTPTSVSATDDVAGKVTLTWECASGAGYYEIWRSLTNNILDAAYLDQATSLTYDDTSMTDETVYYYWVRGINYPTAGSFGGPADGYAHFDPPVIPEPPAWVAATDGTVGDKITVTWAASEDATGYEIWRGLTTDFDDASYLDEVGAVETYDDESPTDLTGYYYWVKAKNANGTSAPAPVSSAEGGYAAVPDQATAPNTTTTDPDKVRITWAAADFAKVYDVYRNTTNSFYGAVTVDTNNTALLYDDTDAELDQAYYYWIVGKNDVGSAAESGSTYGVRPMVAPAAPANVSATDGAYGKVTITWDASAGATHYEVYRYDSTYGYVKISPTGGVSGLSFDYEPTDTGARNFNVTAVNGAGASAYSAGDSGWANAPSTPAYVAATDAQVGNVTITWAAATGAESYKVYRNTVGTFATATLVASGITGLTYDDTPPALATEYYYWVVATAGNLDSPEGTADTGIGYATVCALSLSGGDSGHDVTYAKATTGYVTFAFDANTTIADRLIVYNNGSLVYDTGCITSTASSGAISIAAGTVRIVVVPHCAGGSGTAWAVTTTCS